jgi:hypothetical protein
LAISISLVVPPFVSRLTAWGGLTTDANKQKSPDFHRDFSEFILFFYNKALLRQAPVGWIKVKAKIKSCRFHLNTERRKDKKSTPATFARVFLPKNPQPNWC